MIVSNRIDTFVQVTDHVAIRIIEVVVSGIVSIEKSFFVMYCNGICYSGELIAIVIEIRQVINNCRLTIPL